MQRVQHCISLGSTLPAISLPQLWQPTWTWVAEHWNPFLEARHYLHLSFSSSSEALKSETALDILARPLPLAGGAGLSALAFEITGAGLPWIFYWMLIGSKLKIFLAFKSSSYIGSLFYSGWDWI